jgi:prolyl-tRNA synthetase
VICQAGPPLKKTTKEKALMKTLFPALLLAVSLPVVAQQPGGAMGGSPSQMFMQQMDANQDGSVSLEEFQKPTNEQFKYIDKNGDGNLTADEVETFHQEIQQRMQQMQQMQQQQMQQQQGGGQYGQPGGYGQYPRQ